MARFIQDVAHDPDSLIDVVSALAAFLLPMRQQLRGSPILEAIKHVSLQVFEEPKYAKSE
jgi:hypothetical protein